MPEEKNDSNKKSIWAKISGAIKAGAGVTKDVLFLVPKALVYPIKKPFASMSEVKHDAAVSIKKAVGIDVPKEEEEYDPPIKTTEASKYLGVQITEQKRGTGKVTFSASRTLTGDIPHLSQEQLDQVKTLNKKSKYSSITIFREENKIVIEINVKGITNKIKASPENEGKSPEEIKELVIKAIKQKVDYDLKKLAEITGGEFRVHTDLKLLYGIAEKLYREYDNKERSSETTQPTELTSGEEKVSETVASGKKWGEELIRARELQSCEKIKAK